MYGKELKLNVNTFHTNSLHVTCLPLAAVAPDLNMDFKTHGAMVSCHSTAILAYVLSWFLTLSGIHNPGCGFESDYDAQITLHVGLLCSIGLHKGGVCEQQMM